MRAEVCAPRVNNSNAHCFIHISECTFILYSSLTDPEDYMARTREDAVANPVREGLTPDLLQACIDVTIVDDLVIGEGSEQFLLGLEISLENSNVNAVGCPATATIRDRRMYTFKTDITIRTDIIFTKNRHTYLYIQGIVYIQDRHSIHSGQIILPDLNVYYVLNV